MELKQNVRQKKAVSTIRNKPEKSFEMIPMMMMIYMIESVLQSAMKWNWCCDSSAGNS